VVVQGKALVGGGMFEYPSLVAEHRPPDHRHERQAFTMQAYDAVKLALSAIRRAGSMDRAKVRAAIAATTSRDVTLLSGPSTFQADGTQQHSTFVPLIIRDGTFTSAPVVP